MKVTEKLIESLAILSKLKFASNEKGKIKDDMVKIIQFVNKLSEIDTNNIDPLIHLYEEENYLREDKPQHPLSQKSALKNGPKKDSDYFKVPKVLNTNS